MNFSMLDVNVHEINLRQRAKMSAKRNALTNPMPPVPVGITASFLDSFDGPRVGIPKLNRMPRRLVDHNPILYCNTTRDKSAKKIDGTVSVSSEGGEDIYDTRVCHLISESPRLQEKKLRNRLGRDDSIQDPMVVCIQPIYSKMMPTPLCIGRKRFDYDQEGTNLGRSFPRISAASTARGPLPPPSSTMTYRSLASLTLRIIFACSK